MREDRTTYVYIMGRAHSGTTVLDCLLDNVKGIQGCGELAIGLPRLSDSERQSLPDGSRSFWEDVKQDYHSQNRDISWSEAVQISYDQAHISRLFSTLMEDSRSDKIFSLIKSTEYIYSSIRNVSGSECIVESSKEVTRALFLARFFENSKIIHMVRNPEHVIASTLYRMRHKHGFRFLRNDFRNDLLEPVFVAVSAAGWLIGNIICELIKQKYPNKTISVKYERMLNSFEYEMSKIGKHIGKDLSQIVEFVSDRKPISTGSKVSGNEILENDSFIFEKDREPRDMPDFYSYVTKTLCYPLASKYGYT